MLFRRKKSNQAKVLDGYENQEVYINVQDETILAKMNMINLTEHDLKIMLHIQPIIEKT